MIHSRRVGNINLYRKTDTSTVKIKILTILCATICYASFLRHTGGAGKFFQYPITDPMLLAKSISPRMLSITTWNIAAINNNPFEYWITFDNNPHYEPLMKKIENFIENPGTSDVTVKELFTEKMFSELVKKMNISETTGLNTYWNEKIKNRRIVSGFLQDSELGNKRLISMLDRYTNTINVANLDEPVYRPTVINMYEGNLRNIEEWWIYWKEFMFDNSILIQTTSGIVTKTPYEMLHPIVKSKYPAITEEEENLSLPLQTLCGAIFDSILVHILNTVSSPEIWQPLKQSIVNILNKNKVSHTLNIIDKIYGNSDIITLQEVSLSFIKHAKNSPLGQRYWISTPTSMDVIRDQNSVIMLHRSKFPLGPIMEINKKIYEEFTQTNVPIVDGDIHAITAIDNNRIPYVIASFHGDTNGLATIPVNDALSKLMQNDIRFKHHRFIFGLDANTYKHGIPDKKQDVMEWGISYKQNGLTSCWGDIPQKNNYTTYNARTYLQPQLNKACKESEKKQKGDINPKDYILFQKGMFKIIKTWKDNTGERRFIEDIFFPTLKFPSDHAILATILQDNN